MIHLVQIRGIDWKQRCESIQAVDLHLSLSCSEHALLAAYVELKVTELESTINQVTW